MALARNEYWLKLAGRERRRERRESTEKLWRVGKSEDRQGIMGLVEGKEREGLTIFEVCCGRPMRRNSVLEGFRVR